MTSAKPMMAFIGVRISWLTLARKSDFADEAFSASRLALVRSSSARFHCVTSRNTMHSFLDLFAPESHRPAQDYLHAPDHLAPVVEHALDAVVDEPVQIVLGRAVAFRREQVEEAAIE